MKTQAKYYEHAAKCGAQIRVIRQARGLTLEALGARTGFSAVQIYHVEKGEINTPIETLARIVAGLGVPLYALFRQAEETATTMHCARIATHLHSALAEVEALAPGVVSLCP
jgi:transcriptional regulator with XRE-family HTH domain